MGRGLKAALGMTFSLVLLGLLVSWQPIDDYRAVWAQASLWPIVAAFLLTIQLALWSAFFALVLGTVVAILRLAPVAVLNALGAAYVTLIRNTPLTLIVVACSLVLWGQLGIEPALEPTGPARRFVEEP